VLGRVWRIDAAYQLLNLEAVDAEIAQIAQLAESTRLPLARWHLLRQQASRAALAGQLAVARDRSAEARQLAFRIQDPSGAHRPGCSPGRPPRRRAASTCPARPAAPNISSTTWTRPSEPVVR
jgi:hypothetical protein